MSKTLTVTQELIDQYVEKLKESIGKGIDTVPQLKAFDTDKKTSVTFSALAAIKMLTLVFSCTGEVGWHGTVEKREDGFFIKDIYIYPQFVTGATVTTDDDEYNKWLLSLNDEEFNTMRFHGHSHVNMAVNPSSTDIEHRKQILGRLRGDDYYIFMIINKNLSWTVAIYDMENNVEYATTDIDVKLFEDFNAFALDSKDKIREKKYEYKQTSGSSYTTATTPSAESSKVQKAKTEKVIDKTAEDTKKRAAAKKKEEKNKVIPYNRFYKGYRYPQDEYEDQIDFDDWIYGRSAADYERLYGVDY